MRLFIAIEFPKSMRSALCGAMSSLRSMGVEGKYTRPENLHLTLAFIGESDDVQSICRVMDSIRCRPFTISLEGSGRFGDLIWAGIKPCPELDRLAAMLCGRLRENGFRIEKREFLPHITLVRNASGFASIQIKSVSMNADRITLFRSERIDGILTYTPLYTRRL